jgi:predicted nuclease of predicted toxin-antitoxin system
MPAFLVDENLPRQLIQRAREQGHEARWVRDIMPGASDREILGELLRSEEHLVTRDIRFANTVFARIGMEEELSGVVLIREERMKQIRAAWRRYMRRDEYPQQSLVVLEAQQTRIRRLPPEEEDND